MSQLVPCPGCERHVRLSEANCPFCGGGLDAQALGAAYAPRRNGVNSGIKRAAIFAIGTGMAAACGGKTDDTDSNTQPVASATTDDTPSPTDGAPVAIYGAPVPPTSTTIDNGSDTEIQATPVYGSPFSPTDPVATIDQETSEAAATIDDDTTEIMAQPEYGAPIPDPSNNAAIYGAPPWLNSGETEVDAGAGDAGTDAAVPDEPTMDPGPDPTPQPVYGAPIYGAPFAD